MSVFRDMLLKNSINEINKFLVNNGKSKAVSPIRFLSDEEKIHLKEQQSENKDNK